MKLLVDTNIFLEVLLEQAREDEAKKFLTKTDTHEFFISTSRFIPLGSSCSSVRRLMRSASSSLT